MNEIEKILTAQSVLVFALTRILLEKGIITKIDLLADFSRQPYMAPIPSEVLAYLQELVERLPEM